MVDTKQLLGVKITHSMEMWEVLIAAIGITLASPIPTLKIQVYAGLYYLCLLHIRRMLFDANEVKFQNGQDYFEPVSGGFLLDVSCGSGLFSRKFASSGMYSGVIALDFSENMLRQCYEFIGKADSLLNKNLALVRADISRLPFLSASVDAVAEISSVLKSGGVFVGTTFLSTRLNSHLSSRSLGTLGQILAPSTNTYSFFAEKDIEDLCKTCGLVNYTSKVDRAFIIFSAQKS
ncbi:hypothetical protein ZOSMA_126G00230 [Zostera marina]|uniref:Methyltransferase domain-containing protein n=1 Tax=Zostera marina TaxID=29655 RepID=A0A0K9PZT2_ZOSMR|nr:hypothetical protein ZOSMA_126G00230 [Zostera marina]